MNLDSKVIIWYNYYVIDLVLFCTLFLNTACLQPKTNNTIVHLVQKADETICRANVAYGLF